ncbi:MAG: response regulator [Sedimenticola sp.]|nr:MAG: response regulator [Sedimenticola sp.]
MNKILIIEDEEVIRGAVKRLLQRKDYDVSEAASVEEAEQTYSLNSFNLILTDIRLPGAPGTEVIKKAPNIPVLVMTSYASVRSAVDSIKQGAIDYIAKPFDHDELLLLVERALRQQQLERKSEVLKSEMDKVYPVRGIIGSCQAMQEVFKRIGKVAPTDSTVLILGESGTGKELVARALHEQSTRKDAPIVTVNCAAIPEPLIESELFGHLKGAFTGADSTRTGLVEAADGGTLFLDEIGELPLAAQARLLRVLQNGEIRPLGSEKSRHVDIRLIAATHRDLKQLVQESLFRSDLYFRLRVVELNLPPLRDREKDIVDLARFLLEKARVQLNRPPIELSADAIKAITSYDWPGNVRELENALERAVILCENNLITPDLLAIDNGPQYPDQSLQSTAQDLSLEEYFCQFLIANQDAMTETELAKKLGISRKALWERRQRLGIPRAKKI